MTVPAAKLILDTVGGTVGALTNGATGTSANIDTLGFDFVSIDVSATTQSASTQAGFRIDCDGGFHCLQRFDGFGQRFQDYAQDQDAA